MSIAIPVLDPTREEKTLMLVAKRMTLNPKTAPRNCTLAEISAMMMEGGFRRVPIVEGGHLVGIISDRDVREHSGHLNQIKVGEVMTGEPLTVAPSDTVERATALMLGRKIGGLPVLENGSLVGIITATDVLEAFLETTGAAEEGVVRIDMMIDEDGHKLADASRIIAEQGGEIFSVGTYRQQWEESRIFYLTVRSQEPERIADELSRSGFTVLGLHV